MLKPSNDSKTRLSPNQKNTFGLLPGPQGTCPFATTGCGGCWAPLKEGNKTNACYVDRLMRARPNVRRLLEFNTELMKRLGEDLLVKVLEQEFQRFLDAEDLSDPTYVPLYRLHWSGDIFSRTYARALTTAMSKFPKIKFWIYTRAWEYVDVSMLKLENLSFLLSLDPCNIEQGLSWRQKYRNPTKSKIGISFMGTEIPERLSTYAEKEKISVLACPVDSGNMSLEGGCQKCKACIHQRNNVIFFKT